MREQSSRDALLALDLAVAGMGRTIALAVATQRYLATDMRASTNAAGRT